MWRVSESTGVTKLYNNIRVSLIRHRFCSRSQPLCPYRRTLDTSILHVARGSWFSPVVISPPGIWQLWHPTCSSYSYDFSTQGLPIRVASIQPQFCSFCVLNSHTQLPISSWMES